VPRTQKPYTNDTLKGLAASYEAMRADMATIAARPAGAELKTIGGVPVGSSKVIGSGQNQLMNPRARKLTREDAGRIINIQDPALMARITLDGLKRSGFRCDAGETAIFLRELEQVFREQYDIEYAELKAKQMVPVRYDLDPGAETFTYTQFDRTGQASRIKDFSRDFPRVNVYGSQFLNPVVSYGASFAYSIDELRAGTKAGRSIEAMRAFACRKAIDEMIDYVISQGDPDADNGSQSGIAPILGLLKLTGTQTGTASPLGASSSTTWWNPTAGGSLNKTQDQIIADITNMISTVPNATKGVEKVRRIVLPIFQMGILKNTPRSTVSDTTLLEFLEKNNKDIEFMEWEKLTGSGAANTNFAGNAAGDLVIGYNPDRSKLFAPIAIEYEQLAPQLDNFAYMVPARCKLGGVVSPYPKSLYFLSGT
jgi:hypothetical protein